MCFETPKIALARKESLTAAAKDISSSGDISPDSDRTWEDCMLDGDFAAAWEFSDRVMAERAGHPCYDWPRHLQYIWDGRELAGKRVLVRCYHGLGDTTHLIRYVPQLCDRAKEVVVWAQAELLPLLRTVDARAEFIPLHDGVPQTHYDVDVEIMELPHVFRSTAETLPRRVPYLSMTGAAGRTRERRCDQSRGELHGDVRLDAIETPHGSSRGGGGADCSREFHAGLVWASGNWNPARSVSLEALHPLWRNTGVIWHALQQGDALAEWHGEYGPISSKREPEALARVMMSLDLIVSVDSFPTHLAGALGLPTWLLLSRPADWRWLREGEESLWYPTMRIFRQRSAGDWSSVVAEVEAALATEHRAAKRLATERRPPAG
ncbi:MAG TPA: hypothetical protein VFT72_07030 [Opitutaceae bacterium]|nr:hypothetical protein [Opitutaceae bacterium]